MKKFYYNYQFSSPEIYLFLLLSSAEINRNNKKFSKSTPDISDKIDHNHRNINWDKLVSIFKNHKLLPLAYVKLKNIKKIIPASVYKKLKTSYNYNIGHNLKLQKEFLKIEEKFTKNNISVVPIKGMDIITRHPKKTKARAMTDIDILIKKENLEKAAKLLLDLGYKKNLQGLKEEYWRKKQCHIEFDKKSFIVEVHWSLDFERYERKILPALWERVQVNEIDNHKIYLLSPEDVLFSFTLHLRRFGRILCLKQVIDMGKVIKETSNFDWSYILKEARRGRMKTTVYFFLIQIQFFTNTPIPSRILKELNISFWKRKLIQKFILKNTFSGKFNIKMKEIYIKAHFLIYDSLWEPIWYIINIPYEQFSKFYNLTPYTEKTNLLYRIRLLYMPMKQILSLVSKKID